MRERKRTEDLAEGQKDTQGDSERDRAERREAQRTRESEDPGAGDGPDRGFVIGPVEGGSDVNLDPPGLIDGA